MPRLARSDTAGGDTTGTQRSLFPLLTPSPAVAEPSDPASFEVLAEIRGQDPDNLTPLQALELLAAWHRRLRGE